MDFRKLFPKDKIIAGLKGFKILRVRVTHSLLMELSLLLIVFFMAFIIRMLPMYWGFHLSEFDPYFQFRLAKDMVENGFFHWLSWQDYQSWYPFGRDMSRAFPGVALTAAVSYRVISALGIQISLLDYCIIFPAIMGTLTCLVIYLLGKDFGGKEVALFSSLSLALNASHIGRTSIGWFDDETVGIFGLLLFFLFFLRSIERERPLKNGLIYSVAAGLSLGWLFASWGAARYPLAMATLFVFILLVLRRYSPRLLLSYSTTFGIALFIAINVPKLGYEYLTETDNLLVAAVFLLLCVFELFRHFKGMKTKAIITLGFLGLSFALLFVLDKYGLIGSIPLKFWGILNPFARMANPLIESVAEHRPGAWASIYYEYGIGAFFIPVGLYFTIRDPTDRNVFLSIFALTSLYFASSMVRLTLILAPAFSLLWAVALVRISRPFITIMKEAPVIPAKRKRFRAHVGKSFSAAFLIIMFLLLSFTFAMPERGEGIPRVILHAWTPTTIAAASTPVRGSISDWIDALSWMRYNVPQTAVVASWWDYGYWITNMADKITLCDNGTVNMTQIAQVATMFMSNETRAIEILKKYNVKYVVIFTTFYYDYDSSSGQVYIYDAPGWGDEGKWQWMAQIAGFGNRTKIETEFGQWTTTTTTTGATTNTIRWTDKGKNTVIYKLMNYGREIRLFYYYYKQEPTKENLEYYKSYSPFLYQYYGLENFNLVYFSKGAQANPFILICVYEVVYS
ncbi:MAG: STT3 domain-containing protein [Candidatus Bathyarchaeia archaeon]